jgi:hypothetical protein
VFPVGAGEPARPDRVVVEERELEARAVEGDDIDGALDAVDAVDVVDADESAAIAARVFSITRSASRRASTVETFTLARRPAASSRWKWPALLANASIVAVSTKTTLPLN